ncbi:MAG: hypothetical protein IBX55_01385 [Methyloprofundus sp.]|nr:hypothetical protein [Methyloprofundus sp.]
MSSGRSSNAEVWTGLYSVNACLDRPNRIFVFGDNLARKGCKGQAIIRNCRNAYGVATKVLPSMKDGSFYSDGIEAHLSATLDDLRALYKLMKSNPDLIITFPENGLGTGLAKMDELAPKTFKMMNQVISRYFLGQAYFLEDRRSESYKEIILSSSGGLSLNN